MSTQYANMLRQRMYENNQMGGALMGGYMGGYEGAAMHKAFGKTAREAQKAAWKAAHPDRVFPTKTAEEKAAFSAKMKALREARWQDEENWYQAQIASTGREPTTKEIKVHRAKEALARAEKGPAYKSKKGLASAAKSRMSQSQLAELARADRAIADNTKTRNRLISEAAKGIHEMKM